MISLVFLCSCQPEHPKEYLSISGKIENARDSILMISGFAIRKKIKINPDGSFKDTLKVAKADLVTFYMPRDGRAYIYLNNGYDLKLSGDANRFFSSFQYEGNNEGAQTNNLLIDHYNFGQKSGTGKDLILLEKEEFTQKIAAYKKGMDSIFKLYDNAAQGLVKQLTEQNNSFFGNLESNYDTAHDYYVEQERLLANLAKGKPAPEFNDYENIKGGTKSLKDFKGNFVYIDVWATWCRPCIAQIPFLKQLEKDLEGKNISIISISTDDSRRSGGSWEKAHDKWVNMVKEKNMSGIQLWAGEDDARFSTQYQISSIPRFILIDPDGNIVNHDAMRPTNPNIIEYLTSVGVK